MPASSYPARITRESLGPRFVNTRPVKDPRKDLSADVMNLVCDTVAGTAATAYKAVVLFRGDATGTDILEHREAWDPDRVGDRGPSVVREAEGAYLVSFQSTYPDQNGVERSTGIIGAVPVAQDGPGVAAAVRVDAVTYRIHTIDLQAGPADLSALVFFY